MSTPTAIHALRLAAQVAATKAALRAEMVVADRAEPGFVFGAAQDTTYRSALRAALAAARRASRRAIPRA